MEKRAAALLQSTAPGSGPGRKRKMEFRHEWKHEISRADLLVLRQRLRAVMPPDPHAVDPDSPQAFDISPGTNHPHDRDDLSFCRAKHKNAKNKCTKCKKSLLRYDILIDKNGRALQLPCGRADRAPRRRTALPPIIYSQTWQRRICT